MKSKHLLSAKISIDLSSIMFDAKPVFCQLPSSQMNTKNFNRTFLTCSAIPTVPKSSISYEYYFSLNIHSCSYFIYVVLTSMIIILVVLTMIYDRSISVLSDILEQTIQIYPNLFEPSIANDPYLLFKRKTSKIYLVEVVQ
jgi:hypothetical protein